MKFLLLIIPAVSVIFAFFRGTMPQVSQAVLDKSGEAVELAISLCGIMCFWCGLMKVAERAGLVEKISALLSPVVNFLFRGIKKAARRRGLSP